MKDASKYLGFSVTELFVGQIQSLRQKIVDLKGIKRPSLKRVKKTTDDMLGAYTDASKLMKADFKANLKTVKKDDEKVKYKNSKQIGNVRKFVLNFLSFSDYFRGKK